VTRTQKTFIGVIALMLLPPILPRITPSTNVQAADEHHCRVSPRVERFITRSVVGTDMTLESVMANIDMAADMIVQKSVKHDGTPCSSGAWVTLRFLGLSKDQLDDLQVAGELDM
jgi:hypothetical protein